MTIYTAGTSQYADAVRAYITGKRIKNNHGWLVTVDVVTARFCNGRRFFNENVDAFKEWL